MPLSLYSPWGGLPAPEDIPFLPPAPEKDDRTARTCANWDDGRCKVCGASWDGLIVHPMSRCPQWRSRQA